MKLQQICIVVSLLLVQHCKAQKDCTEENKGNVCVAPAYNPGVCEATSKCQCSSGWSAATDVCNPPAPTISGVPSKVYLKESYTLSCDTPVTSSVITYAWFKDTNDLNKNTKSLTLTSAQATDSGVYKCKITVAGGSTESGGVTLTFQTPGKACAADTACVGTDLKGYTGKCVSDFCECAAGYVAKEDKCQSAATSITASLLILVTAILTHLG